MPSDPRKDAGGERGSRNLERAACSGTQTYSIRRNRDRGQAGNAIGRRSQVETSEVRKQGAVPSDPRKDAGGERGSRNLERAACSGTQTSSIRRNRDSGQAAHEMVHQDPQVARSKLSRSTWTPSNQRHLRSSWPMISAAWPRSPFRRVDDVRAAPDGTRTRSREPRSQPAPGYYAWRTVMRSTPSLLHVTNGESAGNTLRQTALGGAVLSWQDALHEGPVPALPRQELLRDARPLPRRLRLGPPRRRCSRRSSGATSSCSRRSATTSRWCSGSSTTSTTSSSSSTCSRSPTPRRPRPS